MEDANIRADIVEAIQKAFPEGAVDRLLDPDESYLTELYPRLRAALGRIEGAEVPYEREPQAEPEWPEGADPDDEPLIWDEFSSSYHLFYVALTDQRFTYETETVDLDENEVEQRCDGIGTIGCCVAVSLHAPLARITVDTHEQFDDGSYNCPDIEPHYFELNGGPLDMREHFLDMFGDEAVDALDALGARISEALESLGISVLPDEEAQKPAPWLRPGLDAMVGPECTPREITVSDAFFHRLL